MKIWCDIFFSWLAQIIRCSSLFRNVPCSSFYWHPIDHFQVPLCLCVKKSLNAKPSSWKWLDLHENETVGGTHFIWMVSHWNRGTRELRNGPLKHPKSASRWETSVRCKRAEVVISTFKEKTHQILQRWKCINSGKLCPKFTLSNYQKIKDITIFGGLSHCFFLLNFLRLLRTCTQFTL